MSPAKTLRTAKPLLTVRAAPVALAFSTMAEPGVVAFVVRAPMVVLVPARRKVPVEPAPKVTALGTPALKAPELPDWSTPPFTRTEPVKVLFPETIRVPESTRILLPAPPARMLARVKMPAPSL